MPNADHRVSGGGTATSSSTRPGTTSSGSLPVQQILAANPDALRVVELDDSQGAVQAAMLLTKLSVCE